MQELRDLHRIWAVLFVLCQAGAAWGYVQNATFRGDPLHRSDFTDIRYVINDQTVAGLENRGGTPIISSDSSPTAAIQAAMETWSNVPSSEVRFAALEVTPLLNPSSNGTNLVTFADTDRIRSVMGVAVGITLLFWDGAGALTDTDILFNPAYSYSTTLRPDTFDIQATMTHELGHALGMDHSGVAGASMFAVAARQSNTLAMLSADDIAFVTTVYPQPGSPQSVGVIWGRVERSTGGTVRGALVVTLNPASGTIVGGITDGEGDYEIGSVPPGSYLVYAEPLDGPLDPSRLSRAGIGANVAFRTGFLGDRLAPTEVTLLAGITREVNLTVEFEAPALNILGAGVAGRGDIGSRVGAVVEPGVEYRTEVHGEGLDDPSLTEASLAFLGADIAPVGGTLERDTVNFSDGSSFPVLRFRMTVAAGVPPGLASLRISNDIESVMYTGGFKIVEPRQIPAFEEEAVVSAANFLPRGIAPGDIFAIFGLNLGPKLGVSGGLDPVTGRLATMVAEVAVTVNGIPAPLFFVSCEQINGFMPVEVAGLANALVVVQYKQVQGAARSVRIAPVNPGIFVFPETTEAIVLNQDATVNSAENPAPRDSIISLFGSGQGTIDPPLATGQLAPADPLSFATEQVRVTIDGWEAIVTFIGMAPGFTGLLQMNVFVPDGVASGLVLIHLEIAGVPAQGGVTIWVQ